MSLKKYIPNTLGIILSLLIVIPLLSWANNYLKTQPTVFFNDVRSSFEDGIEISNWIVVPENGAGFVMIFDNTNPLEIYIQSVLKNTKITEWEELHIDEDLEGDSPHSQIFITSGTDKIRYKVKTIVPLQGVLKWLFKDGQGNTSEQSSFIEAVNAKTPINIITRQNWGADESLRYIDPNNPPPEAKSYIKIEPEFLKQFADELEIVRTETYKNGKKLIWPIEYPKRVDKMILHHSAGRLPGCEEEEEVLRAIYKYHTITRGWGDFGYNYIIGSCSGKIFEGRAGDFGAIAAHAGKYNTGTVGIMVMGNFEADILPDTAITALSNVVRFLGEKFGIDPIEESMFRGEVIPNVIAHKDVGVTSCPGTHIYERLQTIRDNAKREYIQPQEYYGKENRVQAKTDFSKAAYAAEPFSGNTNDLFLASGTSVDLTFMFKNTGRNVWSTDTFLRIDGNTQGLSFGKGKDPNNISSINELNVSPGHLGTFDVHIDVAPRPSKKEYNFDIIPMINGKTAVNEGILKYRITINTAIVTPSLTESIKASASFTEERIYRDVDPSSEFFTYIKDLKDNNIISDREYFEPKNYVNRGEFAKMISLATTLNNGPEEFTYKDVPENNPFYEYIKLLRTNNITSKQESFNPYANITRGQGIKIVINAMQLQGKSDHIYQDLKGSIFEPYAKIAVANMIVNKNTLFYPDDYLTREQAAKIISLARSQFRGRVEAVNTVSSIYGTRIRTEVGFESDIIKLNGSEGNYDVYGGSKLLTENLSNHLISTVKYENLQYVVYTLNGTYSSKESLRFVSRHIENGVLKILNWVRPENEYDGRQDIRFRDTLEIRYDSSSQKLYVINELPLEKYLYGLGEEPNGMPKEKNKTIAVLARSYAYYYATNGGKHPERFSHLISNGNDQVYRGYDYEIDHQDFVQAVKDTWGEMVFFQGEVVKAPFFSRSNGKTKAAGTDGNTWTPDGFQYTISVEDPWSCDGTSADIGKNLRCDDKAWGHGVGVSAMGAKGLAEEGKSYKDIIHYFYKDIEIKKGY